MAAKTKLRPLIADSCLFFVGTVTECPYGVPPSIVIQLRGMVGRVRNEAHSTFAGTPPLLLARQLDEVEYVLNKLRAMYKAGATERDEDLRVFSESLIIRFVRLLELIDRIDQESSTPQPGDDVDIQSV